MANVRTFTEQEVLALWNEAAGKIDAYLLQEGQYVEDNVFKPFLALIDKQSGSICVQVNDQEKQKALNTLGNNVASTMIHSAVTPTTRTDADGDTEPEAADRIVPGEVVVNPPIGVGYGVENPAVNTIAAPSAQADLNNRPQVDPVVAPAQDVTPEAGTNQAILPSNKVVAPFDPTASSAEAAVPSAQETQANVPVTSTATADTTVTTNAAK